MKKKGLFKCSYIEPFNYPPSLVPSEETDYYSVLVPEGQFTGDYKDYSISSLMAAGVPLEKAPLAPAEFEDAMSALESLKNSNVSKESN